MNDRFLSKAKRTYNDQWITGYYVQNHAGQHMIYDGYIDEFDNEHVEIDPATLCQCTGLKDRKGKLIFEGDVVFIHDDDYNPVGTYVVEWQGNQDYPAFDLDQDICYGESNNISWVLANWLMEVIGNIHDEEE